MDDARQNRFFWGVLLVWIPWIPIAIGLGNAVMSRKATGIAAVAGGLAELFVVWGIGAILIAQIAAIVLLFRAFAPGHWLRTLFSLISVCLSGLLLVLVGFFLWSSWFQKHHSF